MSNNSRKLRPLAHRQVKQENLTRDQEHKSEAEESPEENLEELSLSERYQNIFQVVKNTTRQIRVLQQSLTVENQDQIARATTSQLREQQENRTPENMALAGTPYNKDMAELMTRNIPKFELNTTVNSALELRSFLKACENILNLFPNQDETKKEFFKLIKFRLGYDVQERITKQEFADLKDLENHLRSICHIKLNKSKLITQIRNERQNSKEDVSHFVERLRKLIAQGRSEYPDDKEFENEAIRTLKTSIKNDLISIKLMDSNSEKFEELAEIALTRDSDLHQRNANNQPNTENSDLIKELIEKIKNLEANQTASVQHIRQESRFTSPGRFRSQSKSPQRSNMICTYCKKPGHGISECFKRNGKNQVDQKPVNPASNDQYEQIRAYNNGLPPPLHYPNYSGNHRSPSFKEQEFQNRNLNYFCPPPTPNYSMPNMAGTPQNYQQFYPNYFNQNPQPLNLNYQAHSIGPSPQNYREQHAPKDNNLMTCMRCNQVGHKSTNCFAIMCSACKQVGHSFKECPNEKRRVHFLSCGNCNENSEHNEKCSTKNQTQGNL